jgi:hypothetical protein
VIQLKSLFETSQFCWRKIKLLVSSSDAGSEETKQEVKICIVCRQARFHLTLTLSPLGIGLILGGEGRGEGLQQ